MVMSSHLKCKNKCYARGSVSQGRSQSGFFGPIRQRKADRRSDRRTDRRRKNRHYGHTYIQLFYQLPLFFLITASCVSTSACAPMSWLHRCLNAGLPPLPSRSASTPLLTHSSEPSFCAQSRLRYCAEFKILIGRARNYLYSAFSIIGTIFLASHYCLFGRLCGGPPSLHSTCITGAARPPVIVLAPLPPVPLDQVRSRRLLADGPC